ncbi:hypothetical protein HMPREF1870_01400 [Bacteroidales bacterium KA00344]|nr:hypothetical protein HMPREF1870_01400 [Bacteroidales bacterium KA00344]
MSDVLYHNCWRGIKQMFFLYKHPFIIPVFENSFTFIQNSSKLGKYIEV